MTDDCCEQIANNRSFYDSIALSKQYKYVITVDNIELSKRQSEQQIFNFTRKLITVEIENEVASVKRAVTMVQNNYTWKADVVEITVQNTRISCCS